MDSSSATYAPNGRIRESDLLKQLMPMVRRQAFSLRVRLPASTDVDDLIQAGAMGALEAVRHYRPTEGATLQTYAARRAYGAMVDELRKRDPLSRTTRARARSAEQCVGTLRRKLGRPPSESEVAHAMGCPLDAYQALLAETNACLTLSLDDPDAVSDRNAPAADPDASPEANLEVADLRGRLISIIRELPEREQQVVEMYYVRDLNLKEIGRVLGVTESRVCQLHSQAVLRMRAGITSQSAMHSAQRNTLP
ncbi:MAG TPA: RNA polymerase sigma factor FliA [Nevskiaceae bacterium]|nr:RNA polymerase sigma factor FliA [Nevskiaceae bacterium]